MSKTKKDVIFSLILGEVVGLFLIPTLLHIDILQKIPYGIPIILLVLPILAVIGIIVMIILSRWFPVLEQFGKFAVVGFSNTAIDFGILNLESLLTGITGGLKIVPLNIVSFSFAVANSFIWNKYWVFENREKDVATEFIVFLTVTVIGVILNSGIVAGITGYITPVGNLNAAQWENVAKVIATATVLFWNFLGYKFVVFQKNTIKKEEVRAPL